MNINVTGLDIAKLTFHLVGLDSTGKQMLKKKLSRPKLLAYFANLTPRAKSAWKAVQVRIIGRPWLLQTSWQGLLGW